MRMPFGRLVAVSVSGFFLLLSGSLCRGDTEPDPDEAVLRRAGVSADDKSLLTFFRERAGNDDDLARVDALVRQLGSRSFRFRQEAVKKLIRLGPAADAALSEAVWSKEDLETTMRAKAVLEQIGDRKLREQHAPVVSAALHLLMRKKPEGTAEALLRYLPYAVDGSLTDDLWWSLDALAAAGPKLDPAVIKALDDPVPVRRAAAAYLATRRGDPAQRASARKRLADAEPLVRLRAAQGLLGCGRKEAVPVLIDLLRGTPLEVAWQAEELLHWAAGEQAPEAVLGAGGEAARNRCRDAWLAWWQKRGDALDLSGVIKGGRRPGLVLVPWGDTDRDQVKVGGVWLLGCRGEPRVEVKTQSIIWDMHLLPGGRLLLAEYLPRGVMGRDGGRVTIRDPEGQVVWKWDKTVPVACYPLAGGNVLVSDFRMVTEVTPAGETAWSHNFGLGRRGVPSLECPRRLPNGNFIGISQPGGRRVDLVETDAEGAQVVKQVTLQDAVSLFRRVRIEVTERGTYLLARTTDFVVREVDGTGKTIWKSRRLGDPDVALLKDGTLVVAAGGRVVEITRSGGVAWEALIPTGTWAARPCLRLVRLGFDQPRPADLDLDTSVEYRLAGLKNRDPVVRRWSANLLGDMGRKAEEAVPALIRALDDRDLESRHAAWGGLRQVVGPKTFPLLLNALTAKSPRVRVAAASVCCSRKEYRKPVIPILIKMLKDHEVAGEPQFGSLKVCQAAAISLGTLGPDAAEAVSALADALKSDDAVLRREAAWALGRIGPAARGAVAALQEALNGPDKVIREVAAESLKKIQP